MSAQVHAQGGADELLVILDKTLQAGNLVIANALGQGELIVTTVSTSLASSGSCLLCRAPAPSIRRYAFADILHAGLDNSSVSINVVDHKKKRRKLISGQVDGAHLQHARQWTSQLMGLAYEGVRPHKSIKFLVNPVSGTGKSRQLWEATLQPIFEAAGCFIDLVYTTHVGHAREICRDLNIDGYDAVAAMSGDGIIHEIINGLAERPDAARALRLPIGILPTGSGNALAACVMSPELAVSLSQAALNIIKGRPLPMDVLSVTQGDKRYFSFLSLAFGLIADLDVGTDNQRWMGSTRFVVGYVQGCISQREYACELALRIVEDDKAKMKATHQASLPRARTDYGDHRSFATDGDLSLPPLRFGTVSDPLSSPSSDKNSVTTNGTASSEGWTVFDDPVAYVYAGNIPYMATDLLAFPIARPDGLIDVAVYPREGRISMLNAMNGSEIGKPYDIPALRYYKCEAMRLTPKGTVGDANRKQWLAIDGEVVPYTALQLEAHKGWARVLSRFDGFHLPPNWKPAVAKK